MKKAGYKGEELKFYYPLNVTRPYLPTPEKIYAEISRQLTAVGLQHQAGSRGLGRRLPAEGPVRRGPCPAPAGLERLLRGRRQLRGTPLRREHRRVRLRRIRRCSPRSTGPGACPTARTAMSQYQTINAQIAAIGTGRAHRLPHLRAGSVRPGGKLPGLPGPQRSFHEGPA